MVSISTQPQAATATGGGGHHNHLLPPNFGGSSHRNHLSPLNFVGIFISLFLILKVITSFISYASQIFTPTLLVRVLKTKLSLRLVLLLVLVSVCVFFTINNSKNTRSYNRNDEHVCDNSGGSLLHHNYQQRERRNHLSPPHPIVCLFISLFLILKGIHSFIPYASQIFTPAPLVRVPKTKLSLRLFLLLVLVTVCVFLTINNSKNTRSYNRNDEHACDNSGGGLLYHCQQRESRLQPKTPTSKEHIQKTSVETILNPQKPSSTAAQKPPFPDKKVRSNRVDDQDVSSGTSSPSPQAGARQRKPLSPPLNGSSCSSDDEITSSRTDSPPFILLLPPPPPFEIQPHEYTTYVRVHSVNSSSCDSADPLTGSPDVNVKAERFIGKVKREREV